MCFEILGFDIYIDQKIRPWLIEVNLAPSFQCDEGIDESLKRPLIRDTFVLLNATHKERVRKQIRRREEMQRRIMERTSFKDNLIRQQEKIHEIRRKRFIYENKRLGCLKRIYPSDDSIKQA
jgi:tubulin polyglutamylase TTLL6/13